MKRLQLPKNKFLRLLINVGLIFGWFFLFYFIDAQLWYKSEVWNNINTSTSLGGYLITPVFILLIPSFFITRYIWFEKSRNRTFYGLFNKFKFPNLEPRIYTTTSNADELKKYSDLKDQGIITEEEFQAKKKKLLDL